MNFESKPGKSDMTQSVAFKKTGRHRSQPSIDLCLAKLWRSLSEGKLHNRPISYNCGGAIQNFLSR